jgi:hypothetical protein
MMVVAQRRRWIALAALLFVAPGIAASAATAAEETRPQAFPTDPRERSFCEERLGGELWVRTELYFGRSRPAAPDVTEEEFRAFLATVVTPRFPDGLTVLDASGQFRNAAGVVVREPSKVLILLYPWSNAKHRAIEQIRARYVRSFDQQAVLRTDDTSCVSF